MNSRLHDRSQFVEELRSRLRERGDSVLLRVVISPNFEEPKEFTGKSLLERAEQAASSFALRQERSVVLLLLPHCPELFLLQLGLVLRGHIPAILAWPTARVDAEKYQRNLVHQLGHLPADELITLPRLADNLRGSLPYCVSGLAIENAGALERSFPATPVALDLERGVFPERNTRPEADALFLQFSGGTTGAQKAIVVSSEMLRAQFRALAQALDFSSSDAVVSWLPMYHDMGLIACYWMPLWHGAPSLQISANDWVLNPGLLLKHIERFRGTICWLPNFAFSYLSQRRENIGAHDLTSMRAWINCSEPVRLNSLQEFESAFAGSGVRGHSLQASYAMAETVFAITQTKPGEAPATIPRAQVRRANHGQSELAFGLLDQVYVSSGGPLAGTQVKIVAPDGSLCAEATPGEIYVRAPSLFSGYWGAGGFQTHSLDCGWHATGDFGFLFRGELFVIGRFKDIIIVGGNNIFPEDVEAAVNTLEGIYPGRVVAFGVEDAEMGTQSLAVIAEMKGEFQEDAALAMEAAIRKLVLTVIGTAARYVAVVPQRWIVKSTAGKISRRETRERFVRERLCQH